VPLNPSLHFITSCINPSNFFNPSAGKTFQTIPFCLYLCMMKEKKARRKRLKKGLLAKRRLVILNDDTFEEVFTFKLTLMNVFVAATLGAILIIAGTTLLIAFTPLREYIPGYASTQLKRDAAALSAQTDSLREVISHNEWYLASIKKALHGQQEALPRRKPEASSQTTTTEQGGLQAQDEERAWRESQMKPTHRP